MMDLTCVAPTACEALRLPGPRDAECDPITQMVTDLQPCSRLAIVILDGLGMATWRAVMTETPAINQIAGLHLIPLRSVSPPVTPVCLATIATGARPETHGVRERDDPFRAETIFEVARRHRRASGIAGGATCSATRVLGRWSEVTRRVGSDGEERDDLILAAALRILEEDRPDLFFTQFVALDSASHKHGPLSAETTAAAGALDRRFGCLLASLRKNGYGVLALADHGQHTVDPPVDGHRGRHDDSTEETMIVPMLWAAAHENRKRL